MELDFEEIQSGNRNFYCSQKLWKELKKKAGDNISVSSYIKRAIIEKLIREDPEKKEYYESLQ